MNQYCRGIVKLTSGTSKISKINFINKYPLIRTMSNSPGPIELKIKECLAQSLHPVHLEIVNESYMHNVPKGSESHFKVLVVADKFKDLQLIKRHRMVNTLIKEHLQEDFPHALSIVAKDSKEFSDEYKLEPSPNCRGGFGK